MDEEWRKQEEGYDSDTMVAKVALRYRNAGDAGSSLSFGSPARSFAAGGGGAASSSSSAAAAAASSSGHASHGRQLQLILGAISDVGASLRIIANVVAGGSRSKVKDSLAKLLNSTADSSDDGTHMTIWPRREPLPTCLAEVVGSMLIGSCDVVFFFAACSESDPRLVKSVGDRKRAAAADERKAKKAKAAEGKAAESSSSDSDSDNEKASDNPLQEEMDEAAIAKELAAPPKPKKSLGRKKR